VNVFIGRDGAELGEFPRAELVQRARAGEFQPTDYYWYDGMEDWLLLGDLLSADAWSPLAALPPPAAASAPPVAAPPSPGVSPLPPVDAPAPSVKTRSPDLLGAALVCAAGLVAFVCAIYFVLRDNDDPADAASSSLVSPAPDAGTDLQLRDRAVAALQQKLDRLPRRAEPPLNSFYYDVAIQMNPSFSERMPWSAIIRGRENLIDPATEKTIVATDFALSIVYRDGEWTYNEFRASASNMVEAVTNEIEHQGAAPAPPSLVSIMGLKIAAP